MLDPNLDGTDPAAHGQGIEMGMRIATIDRGVTPTGGQEQVRTAGGLASTPALSTPTYLSTESLTFPGLSLVSLGLVAIYGRATGDPASPLEILLMALALGLMVIVLGLLDPTNDRGDAKNLVGQVLVGLLNTVLLFGVMLGVYA